MEAILPFPALSTTNLITSWNIVEECLFNEQIINSKIQKIGYYILYIMTVDYCCVINL